MKMNKRVVVGSILLVSCCLYLIGCGESSGKRGNFSQSDLAGNWYFIAFYTSAWERGTCTIDADGKVQFKSILGSYGTLSPPADGTVIMKIDSDGVITMAGPSTVQNFHAVMASNKQITIGTTSGSSGNERQMHIMVKRDPTVTFRDADITGPKLFVVHQLLTGDDNYWMYGAGTINNNKEITLTSLYRPSGAFQIPNGSGSFNITNEGIVTLTTDNYEGVMTPDKQTIFGTATVISGNNTVQVLSIFQFTGQAFTQADLTGIWRSHLLLTSDSNHEWWYETSSISNDGVSTNTAHHDSTGDTNPRSGTNNVNLDTSGTMTVSGYNSFNGYVSYSKDMGVFTQTMGNQSNEIYALGIMLKQ